MLDRLNPQEVNQYGEKSTGLRKIQEILNLGNSMVCVDLDDTTKEPIKHCWADGAMRRFLPETIAAFMTIHSVGITISVITEQGFKQIDQFLEDIVGQVPPDGQGNHPQLFNGFIIGEGGSLLRKHSSDSPIFLTSNEALGEIRILTDWIRNNLLPTSNDNEWFILRGIDVNSSTFVRLPLEDDVCMASISLWEKGPHVSKDPSYVERYGYVENAIKGVMMDLNLKLLDTYEAGNGTLRIVPRGINKASAYTYLKGSNLVDPTKTVYVCDGPNDIEIGENIIADGGGVIAVANAVNKLRQIADYTSPLPSGKGFAEAISKIFPQAYQKTVLEMQMKGICPISN